jgi:SAM-dependent methyltransferase
VNTRSSNTNSSAGDRDAEEHLLQHISALHARLSVGVEKLIAPLRDQIIAYKEVVAPLSQDLKKNLAVSWPLLEELQKQDNALQTAIQGLQQKIDQVGDATAELRDAGSASMESLQQLTDRSGEIGERLDASRDLLSEMSDLAAAGEAARQADSGRILAKLDEALAELAQLSGGQSAGSSLAERLENVIEGQNQITAVLGEHNQGQAGFRGDVQASFASVSEAVAAFSEAANADRAQGFDALKAELESGISVISQSIAALGAAQQTTTSEDFEALKYEVQSSISTIHASIMDVQTQLAGSQSGDLQTLKDGLDESLSGLQELMTGGFDSTNAQLAAFGAQVKELQSRDDGLQSDEIRAQISKLDWSLQSVGQNIAALGNKLASIQEDVSNPPMARRTLKSIEDVDHQIGQIARALNAGTALPEPGEADAPRTTENLETAIADVQILLTDIGSQITDALRYYSEDIKRSVAENSPGTPQPAALGSASPENAARFAGLESAALQTMGWLRKPVVAAPASLAGYHDGQIEAQLKDLDSVTFEKWKPAFDSGAESYLADSNANCSTWTSPVARGFRDYLSLFAEGPMLDIGCGPIGTPVYLQGYGPAQITGLEPIAGANGHGFDVVRGVAEFLPWADRSFSTVICATALDHVMDLERSLSEMRRVLREDGKLVLWYANVPGSANYPATPPSERAAVDAYHLFHIDDVWFQPLLAKWFDVVDMRHLPAGGNVTDVFGVFRPRETVVKGKRPGGSQSKPRSTPARRKPSGTQVGKPVSRKNESPAKTAALKPSAVAPSVPSATKADRPASAKSETPAEKTVAKPSVPARKKPARTRAAKSASKPGENGRKPSAAAQSGNAKTTEKSTKT